MVLASKHLHLPSISAQLENQWRWERLDEVCIDIVDCPHSTPGLITEGPLVARSQDIRSGIFRREEAGHVSEETYLERITRAEPRSGDLLYSREGTYFGIAAEVPPDIRLCLGQRMVLLRPDSQKMNFRFLRYWLNSPVMSRHVHGFRDGTVAERLNLPTIRALPVVIPPLKEQHAIAHVLGTLDDKIELNRRMNGTLEAMAQALFKSWFIDATANGLPEGWRDGALDEVAHFLNGLALQNFPPDGEDSLPVIKIAQLRAGNTEGADRASANLRSEYIIEDGDVLFSWSGSLEVVIWCGGRGALNQHLFKITSDHYPRWFYYLWTKHHLPEFRSIASAKVTTMGHIQRHHLSEAVVVIPSNDELVRADSTFAPLIEKIVANSVESRTLAALRDTLLPKLLSGELSVNA